MTPIEGDRTDPAYCEECKRMTPHHHLHDCAHGIPETHMTGTERYECTFCHHAIYPHTAGTLNAHLKFILDKNGDGA